MVFWAVWIIVLPIALALAVLYLAATGLQAVIRRVVGRRVRKAEKLAKEVKDRAREIDEINASIKQLKKEQEILKAARQEIDTEIPEIPLNPTYTSFYHAHRSTTWG
jgi:septal ring factor EnvC (AmiA/AmiB activator)